MKTSDHIKNSSGFKVPKGYFENKTIELSGLKSVESKSGYKVPENYFDSFKVDVHKEARVLKFYNYKTLAIAASLTIILATLLINLIGSQYNTEPMDFSKLDKDLLFDYIEDEMILDHDMYINGTDDKLEVSKGDISDEDVLDYLDDTSIEQLMDY